MPKVAPVAVEPREILPPGTKVAAAASSEAAGGSLPAATDSGEQPVQAAQEKGSPPLIPIIAGVVALVVIGLLLKVVKAS